MPLFFLFPWKIPCDSAEGLLYYYDSLLWSFAASEKRKNRSGGLIRTWEWESMLMREKQQKAKREAEQKQTEGRDLYEWVQALVCSVLAG